MPHTPFIFYNALTSSIRKLIKSTQDLTVRKFLVNKNYNNLDDSYPRDAVAIYAAFKVILHNHITMNSKYMQFTQLTPARYIHTINFNINGGNDGNGGGEGGDGGDGGDGGSGKCKGITAEETVSAADLAAVLTAGNKSSTCTCPNFPSLLLISFLSHHAPSYPLKIFLSLGKKLKTGDKNKPGEDTLTVGLIKVTSRGSDGRASIVRYR